MYYNNKYKKKIIHRNIFLVKIFMNNNEIQPLNN